MSTIFKTPRGTSYDPVDVELWSWDGQRLGKLGAYEEMTFTWNEREADIAELTVPLNDLTATMLPCDGLVLVGLRFNGITHLSMPVQAEARSIDKDPDHAELHVTTSGGWALLDGEILAPSLEDDPAVSPDQMFSITGPLEDVLKRIITVGVAWTGHPVVVLPSQHRGPQVTATGQWDSPAETIKNVIPHTGYRVSVTGWLPGDPQPHDDVRLTAPSVVVDVVPYRDQQNLRWSAKAGDLSDWAVTRKRPTATRVTVANDVSDEDYVAMHQIKRVVGVESASPWNRRSVFVKADTKAAEREGFIDPYVEKELMDAAAMVELSKSGAAVEIDITVEPSSLWEFGADAVTPQQYQIGDMATVDLPVIGEVRQVVTAVELKITPTEMSVIPRIGTPDTQDTSIYAATADTSRRVSKIERKL